LQSDEVKATGDEQRIGVTGPVWNRRMAQDRPTLLDLCLRHRYRWEIAMWVVAIPLGAAVNSVVALMDVARRYMHFAWWEPVTGEFSSGLLMLALIPALLAFERCFPIRLDAWQRAIPWHLLAAAVFSVVHVLGMVGLRHLVAGANRPSRGSPCGVLSNVQWNGPVHRCAKLYPVLQAIPGTRFQPALAIEGSEMPSRVLIFIGRSRWTNFPRRLVPANRRSPSQPLCRRA
jgi:hypothetical protein